MDRETSARVSSIAAHVMSMAPVDSTSDVEPGDFNALLDQAKSLAGSCMSQDETPGNDFRDRLEIERRELRERFTKLGAFIAKGTPGVTDPEQIDLLTTQHSIMEQYLRVLALRTGKLENDHAG